MSKVLDPIVARAISQGILPHGAQLKDPARGSWPTVVLSFLGAWLVAVPLAAVVFLLFGDWVSRGPGALVLGAVLLAASSSLLRQRELPLFVEQLAFPGVLVGGGLLAYGLSTYIPAAAASLCMALVSLATAWLIRTDWVRILLGGTACACAVTCVATLPSLTGTRAWQAFDHALFLAGLQFAAAIWAVFEWQSPRIAAGSGSEEGAIFLDRALLGWVIAALLGLSVGSGRTFLLSELLIHDVISGGGTARLGVSGYLPFVISTGLGLLGVGLLVRAWPSLADAWFVIPALALAGLSVAMPALGPTLLVVCIAARNRRWSLAATAALAALWVLGGFYYSLRYPLAYKAALLLCMALVLAVPAVWRLRGQLHVVPADPDAVPAPAFARPLLALACAAVLAVVNIGIWQKQQLISDSKVLYVTLAPVDPRSLMQGDFMRLAFGLPPLASQPRDADSLYAVGTVDQRGIVTFARYQEHAAVQQGEVAMKLARKHGQWILVTDAWYFEEGSAKRWESARYGEFRVDRHGKALLVGMRDAQLGKL